VLRIVLTDGTERALREGGNQLTFSPASLGFASSTSGRPGSAAFQRSGVRLLKPALLEVHYFPAEYLFWANSKDFFSFNRRIFRLSVMAFESHPSIMSARNCAVVNFG
jgi:hypothetical protein